METLMTIVLSSVISIVITWYFTRKQMKKNEITHFSINSYDVGKGLHDEFPKFQLTYENKEISNDVQVLKGGFLNSGRNDIIGLKNDSDINMILPEGCNLKDIKIRQLSKELGVTACKSSQKPNVINFAINENFMSGESFEYMAIIETSKEIKNLHRKVEFKHRIPNTSEIRDEYIIGGKTQKETPIGLKLPFPFKNEKTIGFFSLIVAIFCGLVTLFSAFANQRAEYSIIEKETDKEYYLYLTPQSQLYISDNESFSLGAKKIISKEELDKRYNISINTDYSWSSNYFLIVFAIFTIIYLIFAAFFIYMWNKKRRIYNLLKQYEQE